MDIVLNPTVTTTADVQTSLKSSQKPMLSSPREHKLLEKPDNKEPCEICWWVYFSLPKSKHCYIVFLCFFLVISWNRITRDWKALKDIYTILNECVWPLVNVSESALSATEWNFSRRCIVPVMCSYHCCFDSNASDLKSIAGCSCLDMLAGPSIMDDLLALKFRQAQT